MDEGCADNPSALMLPSLVQLLMEQFMGDETPQCLQAARLFGLGLEGGPDMAEICEAGRAQLERWLAVFERLHADGPALDAPRAKDGALCEEAAHYILQASLRPRPS